MPKVNPSTELAVIEWIKARDLLGSKKVIAGRLGITMGQIDWIIAKWKRERFWIQRAFK